jgi:hypothetical protein
MSEAEEVIDVNEACIVIKTHELVKTEASFWVAGQLFKDFINYNVK